MTRLALPSTLGAASVAITCALSCKMQNNVPEGMLWNRVLTENCDVVDGAEGTISQCHEDVPSRCLPALPERGLPTRVSHGRDVQG